jgi:hypothetical protein
MPALEKHYSVQEIANLWDLSDKCVRRMFKHQDGVLRVSNPRTPNPKARVTLRVPQSVMKKIHEQQTKVREGRAARRGALAAKLQAHRGM